MIISDWAINNRATVFFLTFIIIVAGLICYYSLPRESSPDIPVPFVFITTTYRGGSPEDIEKLITIPIEDKLKGLSGVKQIKSTSQDSESVISVEFETGIKIDEVLPKVKDKVDLAKVDLPTDLEDDPIIAEMNFADMPVLIIGLSGNFGEKQLGKLADDLKDSIEGIPGVLEAQLAGKVDREIQVQIFPERLTQYNIPMRTLATLIGTENQNVSAGSIKLPQGRFQLRVPGEFRTPEEANELVVAMNNGSPVYLRDIGIITDGLKDRDTDSRVNGENAITVSVKKRVGANVIEIVDRIDALLEEQKKSWPKGLQVTRLMDQAKDIRSMVMDLENNMLSGLLLVIVVVCVAMGLRNSLVVSLSIPLSMLISFIVLRVLGITLNMVVLFSLTLALGMLVDNAIVIVENIYRFMQQGVGRKEAAMRATSEVAWPIIGSGLTTIAAFFPLLWWDGIMGSFMVFIPKTVIVTLASCLFVAIFINPAIASAVMRVRIRRGRRLSAQEVQDAGEHPLLEGGGVILTTYRRVLAFALQNRIAVVVLAAGSVVLCILFWFNRVGLSKPVELFPSPDPSTVYVNFNMPQGCGLNYADSLIKRTAKKLYDQRAAKGENIPYAEAIAKKEHTEKHTGKKYLSPSWLPSVEYVMEKSSYRPGVNFFGSGSDNQIGLHMVDLQQRTEPSTTTKKRIAELVAGIAGADISVEGEEEGPPTGKPINIEISGEDFHTLGLLAEQARGYVRRVPFAQNIRTDYESGSPTLEIHIDRKKAGFLKLSTDVIGFMIRAAFNGAKVSNYREGDEKFDIMVRFDDKNRALIDTLRQIMLVNERHVRIPLTTIADIKYTGGLGRITRINNKRVVTVSADVDTTQTTGAMALQQAMDLLSGSSQLSRGQVRDWNALLAMLRKAQEADASPALARLAAKTPPAALKLAQEHKDDTPLGDKDMDIIVNGLNAVLNTPALYETAAFKSEVLPPQLRALLDAAGELIQHMNKREINRINRGLLEHLLGGALGESDAVAFTPPPGYNYTFTGENEEMVKASNFLFGAALPAALMLILFVLVAQFNSVAYPVIIMSAVLLSLGGVFAGLGISNMSFGIIMSGVGVISLAGVVVNNAIVLVDYILKLRARGLDLNSAIIAAGATRMRPVILTAITTILGLIPMALGWSFDFHNFEFQWESESSQWWDSMAIPVIYGLILATTLTLIVVPVLFSLTEQARDFCGHLILHLRRAHLNANYHWILLYDRVYRTSIAHGWKRRKLFELARSLRESREG